MSEVFSPPSAGVTNLASLGNYPFLGCTGIINGLARWRNSWGLCNQDSAGNGAGGIDVIFACDSIGEGYNSTQPSYDGFHHRVKLNLQAALNPPGVVGGYGFMPALSGGLTTNPFATGFGSITTGGVTYNSVKALGASSNGNNGANGMYFALDGTKPSFYRGKVSSVQFIGSLELGIATASRIDCGPGTPGAGMVGAGTVFSGTHNQTVASGYYGGGRFGTATTPSNSSFITGFDPNKLNYAQWSSAAAGGVSSEYDGIIAYYGDENCGCRCHDVDHYGLCFVNVGNGQYGSYLSDYGAGNNTGIGLPGSGQQGPGNVGTVWADSTIASPVQGSKTAKLYVIDDITNACGQGSSPPTSVATWKAACISMMQYFVALPSLPCVLWLIPPMSNAAALVGRAAGTGTFAEFAAALYQIQAMFPNQMAIIDFNITFDGGYTGSPNWLALAYTSNSGGNQGVHPTTTGREIMAELITQALLLNP